jgi:hypothetical protein
MCDATYTCVEAVSQGGDPSKLCDNTAGGMAYDALNKCACQGNCMTACSQSFCTTGNSSADCKACLLDAGSGCAMEFGDCVNN